MNVRSILLILLPVATGFAGVFVLSSGSSRSGGSTDVDPAAPISGEDVSSLDPVHVSREAVPAQTRDGEDQGGAMEARRASEPSLGFKDLAAYRGHVEPGRIEGVVFAAGAPLSAAPVHVWQEEQASSSDGELSPPPGSWSTVTTDEGLFELTGMVAGRYRVQCEWGDARQELSFEMKPGIGSKRLVCVFGASLVAGEVTDSQGAPLVGARVRASSLGPWVGGEGRISLATTGADGRYRLEGLVEGRYWFTAHHTDLPGGTLEDSPQVSLGAGVAYELDLGDMAAALLIGSLRDADGQAIEGPRLVRVRDVERGVERRFLSDPSGAFQQALPRGTYRIEVGFQNQIQLECGEVVMPSTDLQQDILVPTRPVVFQPTSLDGETSARQVAIELASEFLLVGRSGRFLSELPRTSGELRFYGLPAGEYEVQLGDRYGADGGLEPVLVAPGSATAARELTVYRR